jgi:CheY-like chemotaxis protein
VRRAFRRLLERTYDVHEAGDGAEVIARVEAGEGFDALVLDLEMPRMNGRRTLEALTVLSPTLARRTLVVTAGATSPGLHEWLSELPPGRVFLKPVERPALIAAIGRLLARG